MGVFSLDQINEMYMDILKELGNIGASHAVTSIAAMINKTIRMDVPNVEVMEASKLGSAICPEEETIVGLFVELSHDITGSMMYLMKMDAAHYLANRLIGSNSPVNAPFNEMELSALKEIGNIISSSYLSALASMTNKTIVPSIPYISVDMAASILSVPAIIFGQDGENALVIEIEFGTADEKIGGYFILMPDKGSYAKILTSLGIVV